MEILSQDMIYRTILPHLSIGNTGPELSTDFMTRLVSVFLYRLKTSCQWRMLPLDSFFPEGRITWQGVYYHFRKWAKDGSLRKAWIALLKEYAHLLDLSSVQLDGSHTVCRQGGEATGYQKRKSAVTSNMLYLTDNSGQMLAFSLPEAGQHHDLYQIAEKLKEIIGMLEEAGIRIDGLFLNADPGFDSEQFRRTCSEQGMEVNVKPNPRNQTGPKEDYVYFDEQLYKRRNVIEQANGWMDGYKALTMRYEKKIATWCAQWFLAFIVQFSTKIRNFTKP